MFSSEFTHVIPVSKQIEHPDRLVKLETINERRNNKTKEQTNEQRNRQT